MESLSSAPAAYALIIVNISVSLYAFFGDRNFINQFAFQVRAVAAEKKHYRVVTSSFLHANGPHLLLNMLTIWFFGPPVEDLLGTLGFLVVYFGAILVSGLVSLRVNRDNPAYASLGASDAASGLVLSYCCFYPFEPIYILFIPFGIPAILYGALFILISSRLMERQDRVIAHEGHLGGAIAGAALTVLMRPDVITQFLG
ncbi:MAG TPA: rhomboid family intramembrane serine protease [Parvularcula sp.]|nr:rhomboid family intramembrane serine protease [Parvularcula sp.]HBS31081.1 rhomboid family intramembrane serine protease [Parvularcula sp.]HBS33823.1 rhomboid family intramembrane serine protease [Parvularcula sp.]